MPADRGFLRDQRGAQALEFAIVAPLLFALMFGVFEIGRLMYERSVLSAAAAAGGRAVVLYGAADVAKIKQAITDRAPNVDPADIVLTDESFGAASFKKIEIAYDFNFLIKFNENWSGVTLRATRYAPDAS